jgi:hypothetical protein
LTKFTFHPTTPTNGVREPPTPLDSADLSHPKALLIFGAEDVGVDPDVLSPDLAIYV